MVYFEYNNVWLLCCFLISFGIVVILPHQQVCFVRRPREGHNFQSALIEEPPSSHLYLCCILLPERAMFCWVARWAQLYWMAEKRGGWFASYKFTPGITALLSFSATPILYPPQQDHNDFLRTARTFHAEHTTTDISNLVRFSTFNWFPFWHCGRLLWSPSPPSDCQSRSIRFVFIPFGDHT